MRILTQLVALNRGRQLGRQLREIERGMRALSRHDRARLGTLTLREIGQASRNDFPHLHGTPPEERYLPWGTGTDIGYTRARSDNPEIALRGMALWLAVAYHETKDSPHAGLQQHFRHLMRLLRELKDVHSRDDSTMRWMHPEVAA